MFLSNEVKKSPAAMAIASFLVVLGVLMNRINNFLVAYNPPYAQHSYFPSIGEISVTLGFVAIEVLLFRFFVINFPIVSVPVYSTPRAKFSIRGGAK
jgi:Ni/Fe-hydrogenase subunit HybB-like protein